ncbi:unnamed protein product, partial [Effrenium voratum]
QLFPRFPLVPAPFPRANLALRDSPRDSRLAMDLLPLDVSWPKSSALAALPSSSCILVQRTRSTCRPLGSCKDLRFLVAALVKHPREGRSYALLQPTGLGEGAGEEPEALELPPVPSAEISLQGSASVVLLALAAKCVRRKLR